MSYAPRSIAASLLLCVACGPSDVAVRSAPGAGANLIIISLDTLRAGDISPYGAPATLSPHLQHFADEAVTFAHARSQAPQTAPSHMTLFTSMYPSVHGVQNVQYGTYPGSGRRMPLIRPLPESIPTLAEVLSAAGYQAVALTDGGHLTRTHGFPRGFDEYTKDLSGAEAQVKEGVRWLTGLARSDRPFFLFWHTYEIHSPYFAPEEFLQRWKPEGYRGRLAGILDDLGELTSFQDRFGAMKTLLWKDKAFFGSAESAFLHGAYRAGIEYTDDQLGILLDSMRDTGVLDSSIVVVISDHGEEFLEHGKWQHDQVFEECLRVPLMVRLPGGVRGGTRIETPVALMDVMPTVLELLKIDAETLRLPGPLRMQGVSLASSVLHGQEPAARPIYSEHRVDQEGGPISDWQIAIHDQNMKFIVDEHGSLDGEPKTLLFDLSIDAAERRDITVDHLDDEVPRFLALRSEYKRGIAALSDTESMNAGEHVSDETMQSLIALGYIEASELDDEPDAKPDGPEVGRD